MEPESKKLKRGLEDISERFRENRKRPAKTLVHAGMQKCEFQIDPVMESGFMPSWPSIGTQSLMIYSPENAQDGLFLSTYLASQIRLVAQPCLVISVNAQSSKGAIGEFRSSEWLPHEKGFSIHHLTLSAEELSRAGQRPVGPASESWQPVMFLDVDFHNVPCASLLIPKVEKMILHVGSSMESLTETYKMIKASKALNPYLEYYVLCDDAPDKKRGAELFEKFSNLVSAHLGVSLNWLGVLYFTKARAPFASMLHLETLFLKRSEDNPSLEKQAFASYLESYFQAQKSGVS